MLFLQNIACPTPKTWFATNRTEVTCTKDTECGEDEKCCHWFSTKHCLKGISKVPKHGVCMNHVLYFSQVYSLYCFQILAHLWWFLGFEVWVFMVFWGWGFLYKHRRVNLGEKTLRV